MEIESPCEGMWAKLAAGALAPGGGGAPALSSCGAPEPPPPQPGQVSQNAGPNTEPSL